MGGMFALYFAATRPELIRGIVPINACVYLNDPDLARVVFDPEPRRPCLGVGSDIKAEGVEELVYPEVPVPPVKEFMALMRVPTTSCRPSLRQP
jgi:carboxylesterase